MTREQFIEQYNSFDELYDFAQDNNLYDFFDDYFTEDGLDEFINDKMADMTRYESWTTVRDYLDEVPQGYDWYRIDQYDGNFYGVDAEDCENIKQQILEALDEEGDFWEEEADDEVDEEEEFDEYAEEIDLSAIIAENKVMFA